MKLPAAVALSLLAFAARAKGEVLWRADPTFDDVGRWDEQQSAAPAGMPASADRLGSSRSPVPGESQPVIRVILRAGDVAWNPRHTPPRPLGNRSELVHLPYIGEGEQRWYRWRVFFPTDFAVTDGRGGGAVFAQWHHWSPTGEDGSPPLLFTAMTDAIRLVGVPGLLSQESLTLAEIPQVKGRWRTFVFHVMFSADAARALTELWVDGRRVPTKRAATLFPGYDAYLKMGLYRRPTARENNVIYFDSIVEATRREDVMPVARAGRHP
jgi:hypothetical protein